MRKLSILLLLLALTGCASDYQSDDREAAVVSVLSPSFSPHPGTRFAWLPESEHFYAGSDLQAAATNDAIQAALRSTLEKKGYLYSASVRGSDLLVAYAIALDSHLSDAEITRRYGIQPGLTLGGGKYETYPKGTLIVRILLPGSKQAAWRGAIQAAVTFEKNQRKRQKRLNGAAELLLRTFPASG